MPGYKAVFFFESLEPADIGAGAALGWQEVWYKQSDTLSVETMLGDADLDRYLQLRLAFMPFNYRCSFIRVGDDANPRRFKIRNVLAGNGAIILNDDVPAQVQCAVLADLERLPAVDQPTEPVHHKRFLIRGLPSNLINGNVLNGGSRFFVHLRRFLDFIGNKAAGGVHPAGLDRFSWGLKYLNPTITKTPITEMKPDVLDGRTMVVLPVVPGGTSIGKRFIVQGIPAPLAELNRHWKYLGDKLVDAVQHSRFGTTRYDSTGDTPRIGSATYKPANYLYGPVDQYVIIGLRNKRTGRVFRLLRGRSAARG